MRTSLVSRVFPRAILLLAAALLCFANCEQVDVTTVDAVRVELAPDSATVAVSQTTQLTATVFGSGGQALTGHGVDWSSVNSTIASVDNNGMVRGMGTGTATIRAVSGSATGTATVIVTAAPAIAFAPATVNINAVVNGATPGDRTVAITNSGSGTLSGLSVAAVRYQAGSPTGWLTATLTSTSAPTTLVLSADQGSIASGTYNAAVDLRAGTITGTLVVRLIVLTSAQAIALGSTAVSFAAAQGGANPAEQTVGVTNAGGGALTGLNTAVTYPNGQASGWLTASLSGTTAPATLTLTATTGALPVGTHTATVRVASPVAQNSPQTISVWVTIGGAQPVMALSSHSLSFNGSRGLPNPAAQTVDVTNVGSASLTGLAVSVTYPGGQAAGWLTTQLNTTTAPATISVGVATGTLPNGAYTATLGVTSPVATNSPQTVNVSFQVADPPPSSPVNLSATSASSTQINLSWTAATGVVTRNRIERRTGAGAFAVIDSVAGNATTYQNTGLTAGTAYMYRIRACSAVGCSGYSNEASTLTAPTAPGNPGATVISATQINLSWTAATGTVSTYRVERSTTSGGVFTEIASISNTTLAYQNTGLTAATAYFYRVRACNAGSCSVYTAQATATTLPNPPGAPSGLGASTASSSQINLSWSAATGTVDTVYVEQGPAAGGPFQVIARLPGNPTAYQNTGLPPGTTFHYRVRAGNRGGFSAYAGPVSAPTSPLPPGSPSGLGVTVVSATQINLSWTAATGTVFNYHIERSTTTNGSFAEIALVPGTGTAFQNTGLATATLYYYRVRACNPGGCSSTYTNEASATTLLSAPAPSIQSVLLDRVIKP